MENIIHFIIFTKIEDNWEKLFIFSDYISKIKDIGSQDKVYDLDNFDTTYTQSWSFLTSDPQFIKSRDQECSQESFKLLNNLFVFGNI